MRINMSAKGGSASGGQKIAIFVFALAVAGLALAANPAVASFDSNLTPSSGGSKVMALQQFLIGQGLLTGAASGQMDSTTKAAIAQFQKEHSITVAPGFFGPKTRAVANEIEKHEGDSTVSSSTPFMGMMFSPYDRLPSVPSFSVTSTDVQNGQQMPLAQTGAGVGGNDTSPQLGWSGFPANTKSFVITMFDPDAPTPSGFWHWAVVDIPATTTMLSSGAGNASGSGLPSGAFQLHNDTGTAQYIGAAPPKGNGKHRYFIAINALDVASLGLNANATPAVMSFTMLSHTLGRALIVPWFQVN